MDNKEYEMLLEKTEQAKIVKEKIDKLEEKINSAKEMLINEGYVHIYALDLDCVSLRNAKLIIEALEADLKDLKEQFKEL